MTAVRVRPVLCPEARQPLCLIVSRNCLQAYPDILLEDMANVIQMKSRDLSNKA